MKKREIIKAMESGEILMADYGSVSRYRSTKFPVRVVRELKPSEEVSKDDMKGLHHRSVNGSWGGRRHSGWVVEAIRPEGDDAVLVELASDMDYGSLFFVRSVHLVGTGADYREIAQDTRDRRLAKKENEDAYGEVRKALDCYEAYLKVDSSGAYLRIRDGWSDESVEFVGRVLRAVNPDVAVSAVSINIDSKIRSRDIFDVLRRAPKDEIFKKPTTIGRVLAYHRAGCEVDVRIPAVDLDTCHTVAAIVNQRNGGDR